MKKSEGIQIVQGDRYEADVTITGREFIDAYFCLVFKRDHKATFSQDGDNTLINISGNMYTVLNSTFYQNTSEDSEVSMNIKLTKDATTGVCALNLPGILTYVMAPGKYSYNISVTLGETTDTYIDTLTPIYTNMFEILPPVNPFLYGSERG